MNFKQLKTHLWPSSVAAPNDMQIENPADIQKVNSALLPLLAGAFLAAIWVGWKSCATGPVLMWCFACLAVGGAVGFLFGIPRSGGQTSKSSTPATPPAIAGKTSLVGSTAVNRSVSPNTNLEEVSDWLTKIIVGLTLVHLKTIEQRVMAISHNAASAISATPTDSDVSVATALIVGFSVIGFLCGYLYTRLFLQGAFSRANFDLQRFYDVLATQQSNAPPISRPPPGEPSVPTPTEREAAERVLQVAPADRPDEVLAPLRALGQEYERTRSALPFGDQRTKAMTEIANRMKPLALATARFLPHLTASTSPGDTVAAVMILQMKFDPAYIEWLANRLVDDPAFVGYQAASALLSRLRTVGQPEQQRIKAAVKIASDKRVTMGLDPEAQRDKLIEQILSS